MKLFFYFGFTYLSDWNHLTRQQGHASMTSDLYTRIYIWQLIWQIILYKSLLQIKNVMTTEPLIVWMLLLQLLHWNETHLPWEVVSFDDKYWRFFCISDMTVSRFLHSVSWSVMILWEITTCIRLVTRKTIFLVQTILFKWWSNKVKNVLRYKNLSAYFKTVFIRVFFK